MSAFARKGHNRSKRDQSSSAKHPRVSDTKSSEPFFNVGLHRWARERKEWTSPPPDYVPKQKQLVSPAQRDADAEELYNALLTPNQYPLPRRVPLSELIGILQEVREVSS